MSVSERVFLLCLENYVHGQKQWWSFHYATHAGFSPPRRDRILLYLHATGCFLKLAAFPDLHTFAGLKNPRELNQTNSLLKESK